MIPKPGHVFARDAEWRALSRFAESTAPSTRLGVVSGRRRQGKTYLLNALTEAVGGFYFVAADDTETEGLRRFGEALAFRSGGGGQYHFDNWDQALDRLYATVQDGVIVIDEFPYLAKASPVLPSLFQRALDPGGTARRSSAKLLLCGSAMSVMGGLLAGNAPLRGRASLELVVNPMDYLTAARFWGCEHDRELAVLLHAVVGGTPAYRHELVYSDAPSSREEFDDWVVRTVLNPMVPIFREARYLLAEETDIRDPALYHAVLGAIASGHNTRGGIAGYLGRPSTHIGHPLTVLEDSHLITREQDAFASGRFVYRIAEPLITFYERVMRRTWSFLERGLAEQAWTASRSGFLSQVVGPHFEELCREFTIRSSLELFGELPAQVSSGAVTDPSSRRSIQVDVAALTSGEPDRPARLLALGEAKWGKVMGLRHLDRLRRARDLLAVRKYDTEGTRLICYGGAGFDDDLRTAAAADGRIILIDLPRLYGQAP
ncbi:ATP-binding protein [Planomonospora parontospora]|uniref:ATP-binding protein n=1 Tax=Planomonospora parontospora TaxID=58119 RepID=UPI0016700335|nr:ATP-binding protein [Planomonospora parontospora]GGL45577.1 ATPase [Planomonospora parontospora subsp. antibiotica]GII18644.1 ATPase [Planomonospora parontospora subsp. antibiotica]